MKRVWQDFISGKSHLIKLLVLLSVFLLLASCGKGSKVSVSNTGSAIYTKGEATINDGITTLDSITSSQITSSDDTTVTFSGSPSSITALKPGDIFIVNNTAYKVESVTSSGSQTVVKTSEPELSEVIKTLKIEGDVWLGEEHLDYSSSRSKTARVKVTNPEAKDISIHEETTEGKTYSYPVQNLVIYDDDGDESTTGDQVLANGNVIIKRPHVKFDFEYGSGNDYASLHLDAGEEIYLALSSEHIAFNKSVSIHLYTFSVPIDVSGMTAGTVYMAIPVDLVFGADGEAKIVVDVSQKLTIDTGIEATLDPVSITTTDNSDFDFGFENPQIDGEMTGSIAVNPDADLMFLQYALAGLNNSLGIKATAKANITSSNTCYRITADADASSAAYIMIPKVSMNWDFLWDDDDSSLLDFDMEEYPKELFAKTWELYDSGDTCAVTYEAPVANAGSDANSNTNATVLLDGTGSYDNDGTIASYQWAQTAGSQVSMTDADTATPSFTAPATADTLSFQLTVTGNNGSTATDSVTVSVMTGDSNYRPTANAGLDQTVNAGATVYSDGSGSSDSDGSIASYSWTQTGGTNVSLTNSNTSTPSFTAPSSTDSLTFKLTVTDNKEATASDYVQVFVQTSDGGGSGVPSAPSGVSATVGDGQVSITWDGVSGVTSYNIYWSTTSGVSKTNGTNISNVTSPYTHTGRTNGTTYYYVVTAVNSYGESTESSKVSATPNATPAATGRMPDTNQTTSYTNTFGEDHDYTINPPSYTDNGDSTITDNVTGLVWQKQDDATKRTWADAGTYCDASTLGGYSDWRLPSQIELISLIDYGVYYPSINTTFFPGTSSYQYWSSTTDAFSTSYAWYVGFAFGQSKDDFKTYSYYVRCVRGGQTTPSLTDNGNGTVTDSGTLLTWQQGENSTMTWESALTYCEGLSLAGSTDWRLPNGKELLSLVDYTRNNPSINTTLFPSAISSNYCSSTTWAYSAPYAEYVDFDGGGSYTGWKTYGYYVRCVRGGQ